MGKQLWTAALTTVLTLLVTIGFRYLDIRSETDKGRVVVGSAFTVGSSLYSEVDVENWSSETLNNLVLIVPSSVQTASIASSSPLLIDEAKGNTGAQDRKRITFSGIPPHRITRMMIPLSAAKDLDQFMLPNVGELKYSTNWSDTTVDPWDPTVRELLVLPLIMAILYGVYFYLWEGWSESRLAKSEMRRKETAEKLEKHEKKTEKVSSEIDEIRATHVKYRIYLLARIGDYSRELEFWRNAMRKIVLSAGMGKQSAEELVMTVTKSLDTWGTTGNASDYDTILEAARMVTKSPELSKP